MITRAKRAAIPRGNELKLPQVAQAATSDCPPSPAARPRPLALLVKVTVSLGLLAWLIRRADLVEVFTAMGSADLRWLACAALSPLVGNFLTAKRWAGLLRALGVHIAESRLFQTCLVGVFAQQFLPSTIGGDAVRIADTCRAGVDKARATAAVLADRFLGLWPVVGLAAVAAVLLLPAGTPLAPAVYQWILPASAVFFAAIGCLLVWLWRGGRRPGRLAIPKVPRIAARLLNTLIVYRANPRAVFRALVISVVFQINVVTFYYLIGRALGFPIPYGEFFLLVPIAVLTMLLPISINGIGLREGIFAVLLGAFGVTGSHAIAFAWLEYGIVLAYGILGGVLLAVRRS